MAINKKNKIRIKRRALRVRSNIKRYSKVPRVSVFRSLNHIYVQVIDDINQNTLVSCSSFELRLSLSGDKKSVAHAVGIELAKRAKECGIESIVFDRGSFLYHGRVQSLAQGLREGGMKV